MTPSNVAFYREQAYLWLYALALSAFAYLEPIMPIVLAVYSLLIADTFLGVWAARKRGERLTSKGLTRMVAKMTVYSTVIFTLFNIDKYILFDNLHSVKVAAMSLAIVEVVSLLENAGTIIEKPVFKFLIDKIMSKSTKYSKEETKPTQSRED